MLVFKSKTRYRIEEEDGLFFPQKKGILYGWNYFLQYIGMNVLSRRIRFDTLLKAHRFIRQHEANQEVIKPKIKYHYV